MFHFVFRLTVCSPGAWLEVGKKSSNRSDRLRWREDWLGSGFVRFRWTISAAFARVRCCSSFTDRCGYARSSRLARGQIRTRTDLTRTYENTSGGFFGGGSQSTNGQIRNQEAVSKLTTENSGCFCPGTLLLLHHRSLRICSVVAPSTRPKIPADFPGRNF